MHLILIKIPIRIERAIYALNALLLLRGRRRAHGFKFAHDVEFREPCVMSPLETAVRERIIESAVVQQYICIMRYGRASPLRVLSGLISR